MLDAITTTSFTSILSPEMIALLAWTLIWKGLALWKAARKESKPWFIVLLLVNTVGLLEILYIFVFSKFGKKKEE
jgi:uncharacterized membrane protein